MTITHGVLDPCALTALAVEEFVTDEILPRTEFGMLVTENDHGADDINHLRHDIPRADEVQHDLRVHSQITALLDEGMPVGGYKTPTDLNERRIHGLGSSRITKLLREPDMYDDGYAVWIGPTAAVSVPVERVDEFRAYMHVNGMVGGGAHYVLIHPYNGVVSDRMHTLITTCRPQRQVVSA